MTSESCRQARTIQDLPPDLVELTVPGMDACPRAALAQRTHTMPARPSRYAKSGTCVPTAEVRTPAVWIPPPAGSDILRIRHRRGRPWTALVRFWDREVRELVAEDIVLPRD